MALVILTPDSRKTLLGGRCSFVGSEYAGVVHSCVTRSQALMIPLRRRELDSPRYRIGLIL